MPSLGYTKRDVRATIVDARSALAMLNDALARNDFDDMRFWNVIVGKRVDLAQSMVTDFMVDHE